MSSYGRFSCVNSRSLSIVSHSDITKKFKMAAINRKWIENNCYILFSIQDSNEIPTATPMFVQYSFTIGPVWILCCVCGSEKFNMAAIENKWYLSVCTRQQRNSNGYTCVFGVQLSSEKSGNVVRPTGKNPEIDKSKTAASNFKNIFDSSYTRQQRNTNGYNYVFGSINTTGIMRLLRDRKSVV